MSIKTTIEKVSKLRGPWRKQGLLSRLLRKRRFKTLETAVAYFPSFSQLESLRDQASRAAWYLPYTPNVCHLVTLSVEKGLENSVVLAPSYMAQINPTSPHLKKVKTGLKSFLSWIQAGWILVWQVQSENSASYRCWIQRFQRLQKKIIYVDPYCVTRPDGSPSEYLTYSNLLWRMVSEEEKSRLSQSSSSRFVTELKSIRETHPEKASLYGNGPGLLQALDWPRPEGLRIGCNAMVAHSQLLDHLRPQWICAVDPASHYGPSSYAHRFREDLERANKDFGIKALFRLEQSFHIFQHYPSYSNWIYPLPSNLEIPFSTEKMEQWIQQPSMLRCFGVMPSIMMPFALSLTKKIELIGVDGQSPEICAKSSWAYAEGVHYQKWIDSRIQCHPSTKNPIAGKGYQWIDAAMTQLVEWARSSEGIQIQALTPSHLTCFKKQC
jgi:hypothetical protein